MPSRDSASAMLAAITRSDIADFVAALIYVYSIVIFAWVIMTLLFSFGVRPPYARWSNAILDFLRDVTEPYLRIFRRFLPMFGPLDLSPLVGLIVLQLVGRLVISLIRGY
jgi:YggT family protein